MSSNGALVEASVVPTVGAPISLIRGSLQASGHVVWRSSSRFGMRFSSEVNVDDWLKPPANQSQARIDQAVSRLKAGQASGLGKQAEDKSGSLYLQEATTVVASLLRIVANRLLVAPDLISTHARELQALDIAAQALEAAANHAGTGLDTRLSNAIVACSEAVELLGGEMGPTS